MRSLGPVDLFHLPPLIRGAYLDVCLLSMHNSVFYTSYLSREAARVPWAVGQDRA